MVTYPNPLNVKNPQKHAKCMISEYEESNRLSFPA